jgi:hypothetical protein
MSTTQEFFYEMANVHNIANLESVLALDTVEAEEGQTLTDKSVLGEDEAVFFKRLLKIACGEIYKRIHRRGRGVTDPYQFDVEHDSNPGYVIFTLNFPDNFDTNLFPSVDSQILECMIYHVLAGWFSKARRNYLAEDFQVRYNNAIDELKSIIEMRTLVRKSSVFWDRYYIEEETEEETT